MMSAAAGVPASASDAAGTKADPGSREPALNFWIQVWPEARRIEAPKTAVRMPLASKCRNWALIALCHCSREGPSAAAPASNSAATTAAIHNAPKPRMGNTAAPAIAPATSPSHSSR